MSGLLNSTEFAVTDVETTGFSPRHNDRIVEIAICRIDCNGRILKSYETLVNPQRDAGPHHVHGLTAKELRNAPTFEEIAGDVIEHLSGAVFVAHNASFDLRFVTAAIEDLGHVMPAMPVLCTLRLVREHGPSLASRKLASCCEALNIPFAEAHSAAADVAATRMLLLNCLSRIRRGSEMTLPEVGILHPAPGDGYWPNIPASGKSYTRENAKCAPNREASYLASLIDQLPFNSRHDVEECEYLTTLDRVLEDRVLTREESDWLFRLALEYGLSQERVQSLHREYLEGLVKIAWQDRILTDAERRDITEVAGLLSIASATVQRLIDKGALETPQEEPREQSADIFDGCRICFTGQMRCTINDESVTRAYAEKIAEEHGLVVMKSVTKRLDVLVVADPYSMSTKARKAQQYGIRIVAEPVFWRLIGVDPG